MRKTFAVALGAALAGALALAAFSVGATDRSRVATLDGGDGGQARLGVRGGTDKYKGRFKGVPNGKIIIKAKTEGGVPTRIKKMSYRNLPAECPESGFPTISGSWTLAGVTVNDRRKFKADGESADGRSSLKFVGKFTADFDKVKGRFQTDSYFPPTDPPEETCVSETRKYVAKR
jgi:hypothetical protein